MQVELEVQAREKKSKGAKRKLFKNGLVPAVVYGKNIGNIPIKVDLRSLGKIVKNSGLNTLIKLKIKGNEKSEECDVLIKAVQRDPVRRNVIHVDFHQISLKDKVLSTVPIHITGTAPGVAAGGVLTTPLHRIEVECLATQIPDSITVDVSELDIGDVIAVENLSLSPDIRVITDPNTVLATVSAVSIDIEEEEKDEEEDELTAEVMDSESDDDTEEEEEA